MSAEVILITPPFTQLNTPYPATAYLKGFLNTKNITAFQADLGIEVILKVFTKNGLNKIFDTIQQQHPENADALSCLVLRNDYVATIEPVILFLQNNEPTLAHRIAAGGFLPEGPRFQQYDNLDWAFGHMGVTEKAKYMATMYLEDIADIISTFVDPHFGFSRYAERLARSANSFDELYQQLLNPPTFFDTILFEIIHQHILQHHPKILAISAPFPGNVYAGFRCAQFVKQHFPQIKTVLGGGFANTELRAVADARVFEFFDFIILDDGEAPIEQLVNFVRNNITIEELKRTFTLVNNKVVYINNSKCIDYKQFETGTPDYGDLLLDKYIAAIEVINPMHSLWSNGRWNKLTMAHGCYWGKCTFCDISLNYIQAYEPLTAAVICDRMEQIMAQTGESGFHFVDEAAPPSLMRAVALEI
ncbi:MAG TPA: radical SAM protein, partial [Chitinophagales bacterium]|nr:radical SAM protein [Chitinophagales bacterium]